MKRKCQNRLMVLFMVLPMLCALHARAQWVPTNGPGGGTISAFHVSGGTIYAISGLAFRSDDTGLTWSMSGKGLEYEVVYAVTGSAGTLYAGTDSGIYRSTNNGADWTLSNTGLGSITARPLAACGSKVLAKDDNGIYLSGNNGTTWQELSADSQASLMQARFFAITDTTIIAAGDYFILVSQDNGRSWEEKSTSAFNGIIALNVHGNRVFAGFRNRLLFSDDRGVTWTPFNEHDQSMTFFAVTISKDSILTVNETGIYLSPVEGGFWRKVRSGCIRNTPDSVACTSITGLCAAGNTLLAGTRDNGIYRSVDNGRSWAQANQGMRNIWVGSLAVTGTAVLAKCQVSSDDRIFMSNDNGTHWKDVSYGLPLQSNVPWAVVGGTAIVGPLYGIIYRWDPGDAGWDPVSPSMWYVNNIVTGGNKVYAVTSDRICSWTENGLTWTQIEPGISEMKVECLAAAGDTIMAKTPDGIFVSTDNGATWIEPDTNIFYYLRPTSLTVIGSTFFAGSNGVFRSVDLGKTWIAVNDGLTQRWVNSLVAHRSSLFASNHNGGVFVSNDFGDTWTSISTGLVDSLYVSSLAVHDSTIFAGTFHGVWRRPLSDVVLTGTTAQYAAPQSDGVTMTVSGTAGRGVVISFSLLRRERVTISVYDISGAAVNSTIDRFFGPGLQTLHWDARSEPAGCYLVKIATRSYNNVKKITLLR